MKIDISDATTFRQDAAARRRLMQSDVAQMHKAYLACLCSYRVIPAFPFTSGGCCCFFRGKGHRCGHPVLPLTEATTDFDVVREWLSDVPGLNLMIVTDDGRLEYLDMHFPAYPNTKAFVHGVLIPEKRAMVE